MIFLSPNCCGDEATGRGIAGRMRCFVSIGAFTPSGPMPLL